MPVLAEGLEQRADFGRARMPRPGSIPRGRRTAFRSQDVGNGGGETAGVAGLRQSRPGAIGDLADAADVSGGERRPAGQRFAQHVGQTF